MSVVLAAHWSNVLDVSSAVFATRCYVLKRTLMWIVTLSIVTITPEHA
ncbi:hypothetical protein HKBW3S44_01839, partial [Candidatus Hakubella thermalkaliphila]